QRRVTCRRVPSASSARPPPSRGAPRTGERGAPRRQGLLHPPVTATGNGPPARNLSARRHTRWKSPGTSATSPASPRGICALPPGAGARATHPRSSRYDRCEGGAMSAKWNLVTGATGLLGSHVVERLAARGERVRALVRPTSDLTWLRQLGAEIVAGDLRRPNTLTRAVARAGVLYPCAAP